MGCYHAISASSVYLLVRECTLVVRLDYSIFREVCRVCLCVTVSDTFTNVSIREAHWQRRRKKPAFLTSIPSQTFARFKSAFTLLDRNF